MKAYKGIPYIVLVDGESVATFHGLTYYSLNQRRNVERDYGQKLGIPYYHVKVYETAHIQKRPVEL